MTGSRTPPKSAVVDAGQLLGGIYDLLVLHAGAEEDGRGSFVRYFLSETRSGGEWRFVGTLGFGGKFYRNSGGDYVSCYREDLTPERDEVINRVNEAIARLISSTTPPEASPSSSPNSRSGGDSVTPQTEDLGERQSRSCGGGTGGD